MNRFKLKAENYCEAKYMGVLPKSFKTIKEALDFANGRKCIHESYLLQYDPDNEDIIISMQEIADVFESGEHIEDFDFF